MKSISLFWLTFVFLWCGYSTEASGDRYSSLILQAEAMFRAGQYPDAAIAYERASFWAGSAELKAAAFLGKVQCLKAMKRYSEAVDVLNRVDHSAIYDSMAVQVRVQSALCSYLDGRFANASAQLQQLFFYVPDTILTTSALPLYALSLNEQGKWSEAKSAIRTFVVRAVKAGSLKNHDLVRVNDAYDPIRLPLLKSARKARIWSSIVPGTGQAYAGFIGEGMASFGLNLSALAFLGLNIWNGYYITTFTVSTMLMQTTYNGGLSRTAKLVEQYNLEAKLTYNNALRNLILDLEQSSRAK